MESARFESSAVKCTLSLVSPQPDACGSDRDKHRLLWQNGKKNPHSQQPMVGRGCPTDEFVCLLFSQKNKQPQSIGELATRTVFRRFDVNSKAVCGRRSRCHQIANGEVIRKSIVICEVNKTQPSHAVRGQPYKPRVCPVSSMVEQTAVNRQATGSSPVSPASGYSTNWMSKWIQ